MATFLNKAQDRTAGGGLRKAGDAHRDPADLSADQPAKSAPPAPHSPSTAADAPVDRDRRDGLELRWIKVDDVTLNPRNRRNNDQLRNDPRTTDLARSMAAMGQLQPGLAVPAEAFTKAYPEFATEVSTPWVALYGNRRTVAARMNNVDGLYYLVSADVETDQDKLDRAPVIENLHRSPDNPILLAQWLQEKHAEGLSQRKIASMLSRTQGWVSQMLKLLELTPELQKYVLDDEVDWALARKLLDYDETEQMRIAAKADAIDTREERAEFWASGPPFLEAGAAAPPPKRRSRSGTMVIRLSDPSPTNLATALRKKLSDDDLAELVKQLTGDDPQPD